MELARIVLEQDQSPYRAMWLLASCTEVTEMNRTALLLLIIAVLGSAILFGASRPAYAAKLFVVWTAPTQNTDGSPLTDLTGYRIEWGSCNADGSFGTFQAGVNVGASVTRTAIYPTGLKIVCAHVFAINSKNVLSDASNTASSSTLPTLSQPTH